MMEEGEEEGSMVRNQIWECKIGEVDAGLVPNGADLPMRMAVREAYRKITGREPDFLFSGWGAELTGDEREAVNRRY